MAQWSGGVQASGVWSKTTVTFWYGGLFNIYQRHSRQIRRVSRGHYLHHYFIVIESSLDLRQQNLLKLLLGLNLNWQPLKTFCVWVSGTEFMKTVLHFNMICLILQTFFYICLTISLSRTTLPEPNRCWLKSNSVLVPLSWSPAPHLLMRHTCSSFELIDSVLKLRTWTYLGPDCALRHTSHSSFAFLPACPLSTLPVPDLISKPAFLYYLPAFCPRPQTLDFPSHCRHCLFWTFLPRSSPGNLTSFRLWLRDCRSLFTICAVNKAVLFHLIVPHLVPTSDPDIHKSVCSNLELSKLSYWLN